MVSIVLSKHQSARQILCIASIDMNGRRLCRFHHGPQWTCALVSNVSFQTSAWPGAAAAVAAESGAPCSNATAAS